MCVLSAQGQAIALDKQHLQDSHLSLVLTRGENTEMIKCVAAVVIALQKVFANGRTTRAIMALAHPPRHMLAGTHCQWPRRSSNVGRSAATKKLVDNGGRSRGS